MAHSVVIVATVKNEENNIQELLDSIKLQTRFPDEVIIVDGGSTDNTVKKLIEFKNKDIIPTKIFIKPGTNISQALNIAIKNSNCDIIACTAAGTILDKNWIKNLLKPFERDANVKVVSGWYEPDCRTPFEKVLADVSLPKLEEINPDKFIPSSRSMAFHRLAWEKIGGFPEWLTPGDDTYFSIALRKAGYKFYFASDAVVRWRPRKNMKDLWVQCFRYANADWKGGMRTGIFLKLIFTYGVGFIMFLLGFWKPIWWIIFIISALLYIGSISWRKRIRKLSGLNIVILMHIANIAGWLSGILKNPLRKR